MGSSLSQGYMAEDDLKLAGETLYDETTVLVLMLITCISIAYI